MTAFLPARSLAIASIPWLSAALAVTTTALAVTGAVLLRSPAAAATDDALGTELVVTLAPIVTQSEAAAAQASAEATQPDQDARPEVEKVDSRPTSAPELPTEQASPSEAEDPDLRMAQEQTLQPSETAPEAVQATEASEAQQQHVRAEASSASQASVATQADPGAQPASAPEHGNARESARRIAAWHRALFAHIARFKTYPQEAHRQRLKGEVVVVFQLGPDGRVRDAHVGTGSGVPILDRAAVEVLDRASPLPRPPAEMGGGVVELHLPMRYEVR